MSQKTPEKNIISGQTTTDEDDAMESIQSPFYSSSNMESDDSMEEGMECESHPQSQEATMKIDSIFYHHENSQGEDDFRVMSNDDLLETADFSAGPSNSERHRVTKWLKSVWPSETELSREETDEHMETDPENNIELQTPQMVLQESDAGPSTSRRKRKQTMKGHRKIKTKKQQTPTNGDIETPNGNPSSPNPGTSRQAGELEMQTGRPSSQEGVPETPAPSTGEIAEVEVPLSAINSSEPEQRVSASSPRSVEDTIDRILAVLSHLQDVINRIAQIIGPNSVPNAEHRRGLTQEQLDTLPTRLFSHNNNIKSCPICLNEYTAGDTLRQLTCMHEFHQECIDRWLAENRTCPLCRQVPSL